MMKFSLAALLAVTALSAADKKKVDVTPRTDFEYMFKGYKAWKPKGGLEQIQKMGVDSPPRPLKHNT